MIPSRDPGISSLRRSASAGGVSLSLLPHRTRVGTTRRAASADRSMVLAACTSSRIVSGRQERSSCIPRLTAPSGAPGPNRIFFAIEKKTSLRSGPGRYASHRSPGPSTLGSFAQLARRTRPFTAPGRWAASAMAIAPPSEGPAALAPSLRRSDRKLGAGGARRSGGRSPLRRLAVRAGRTLFPVPRRRHRGVRQRVCDRQATGRDRLETSECENQHGDDDEQECEDADHPIPSLLIPTLDSWMPARQGKILAR